MGDQKSAGEDSKEDRRFHSFVERSSEEEYAEGMVRGKHVLRADEPDWIEEPGAGNDAYPAPVDYVVFGLIACQLEVLDQALKKARVDDYSITVEGTVDRIGLGEAADEMLAHHSGRINHIGVDVTLTAPKEHEGRARRCLEVYDTGCVVGQSYQAGIEYESNTNLVVED